MLLQVLQNPPDQCRVLDAGNDFQLPAAALAAFDVDGFGGRPIDQRDAGLETGSVTASGHAHVAGATATRDPLYFFKVGFPPAPTPTSQRQ